MAMALVKGCSSGIGMRSSSRQWNRERRLALVDLEVFRGCGRNVSELSMSRGADIVHKEHPPSAD